MRRNIFPGSLNIFNQHLLVVTIVKCYFHALFLVEETCLNHKFMFLSLKPQIYVF
ncbi:hypothetical protein Hanom_Chr05g00454221 [Helianthus anomalus]